jgi:hypothetical protein
MATHVRRIDYYYTTIQDRPGESYRFLAQLADLGVNLAAFTAVPIGPNRTQLSLFPNDDAQLEHAAQRASMVLDGPHPAIFVQGADEIGALAAVHETLGAAQVNVYASTALTDGQGQFGYMLYVRPEDYPLAAAALGL